MSTPSLCLGVVCFSLLFFSRLSEPTWKDNPSLFQTLGGEFLSPRDSKVFLGREDFFVSEEELYAVDENCLRPCGPITLAQTQTLASMGGQGKASIQKKEILEYTVQEGETLSVIAEKFGISLNTILWANNLSQNSVISPGQELTILPISGTMHLVKSGETVSYLAGVYEVDAEEIIEYNELSQNNKIVVGDLLIIPGGKEPAKPVVRKQQQEQAPIASTYFICPIPKPCGITQGLHWYNAIDFSNGSCGEPVFASAGGTVQRTGYHYIAGNYVRILHPNGVVTLYGHLSRILVSAGQRVYQGQIIGRVGNTGYTLGPTGCHVHFEVRGARNPFAY